MGTGIFILFLPTCKKKWGSAKGQLKEIFWVEENVQSWTGWWWSGCTHLWKLIELYDLICEHQYI